MSNVRIGNLGKQLLLSNAILLCFAMDVIPANAATNTIVYTYDNLDRLVSVTYGDVATITYEYDDAGNILQVTETVLSNNDSDNDFIPDSIEEVSCTDPYDADTDDDGIIDGIEDANLNGELDPGELDPCNPDTDGDLIQDGTESGYTLVNIGPDTDPTLFQPDLDPTTTTDPLLVDTDGDGRNDGIEDANCNGCLDTGESDPAAFNTRAMPWIELLLLGND